jgi:hypothetical protein
MLYAGLDLSRKRLDFHLLDGDGATVDVGASPPDADGLRGLSQRLECQGAPIRAAIESMNGARFVHDRLELARRDLVPAIWLSACTCRARACALAPAPGAAPLEPEATRARVLLTHGKPCPVSDLFGVRGRQLLARLGLPEPWQGTIEASLRLIDELDREIGECERELRRLGAAAFGACLAFGSR